MLYFSLNNYKFKFRKRVLLEIHVNENDNFFEINITKTQGQKYAHYNEVGVIWL